MALFNAMNNREELIEKYKKIDEDVAEEMFVEQDLMFTQSSWNCCMLDAQYNFME